MRADMSPPHAHARHQSDHHARSRHPVLATPCTYPNTPSPSPQHCCFYFICFQLVFFYDPSCCTRCIRTALRVASHFGLHIGRSVPWQHTSQLHDKLSYLKLCFLGFFLFLELPTYVDHEPHIQTRGILNVDVLVAIVYVLIWWVFLYSARFSCNSIIYMFTALKKIVSTNKICLSLSPWFCRSFLLYQMPF